MALAIVDVVQLTSLIIHDNNINTIYLCSSNSLTSRDKIDKCR